MCSRTALPTSCRTDEVGGGNMGYNSDCPAWGSLTWPKVGEFNLANGGKVPVLGCQSVGHIPVDLIALTSRNQDLTLCRVVGIQFDQADAVRRE